MDSSHCPGISVCLPLILTLFSPPQTVNISPPSSFPQLLNSPSRVLSFLSPRSVVIAPMLSSKARALLSGYGTSHMPAVSKQLWCGITRLVLHLFKATVEQRARSSPPVCGAPFIWSSGGYAGHTVSCLSPRVKLENCMLRAHPSLQQLLSFVQGIEAFWIWPLTSLQKRLQGFN